MRIKWDVALKKSLAIGAICFILAGQHGLAQNLGAAPASNVAVQGETGAQPEGAFLNFINWVGNVIAPVGAGGAVLGAIVSWLTGRGFGRWLLLPGPCSLFRASRDSSSSGSLTEQEVSISGNR
jgi:hypothetical protein